MRSLLAVVSLLALLALPVLAQRRHRRFVPVHRSAFTLRIGGGINPVVGESRGHLDFGGHATVGVGYQASPHLALLGDFSFYGFGVDKRVLAAENVPGGQAHMWTFTLDPMWRLSSRRNSAYVIAGVGYYDRVVQFTQPTLAQTVVYDPWFGYIGPALVPANVVIGSFSSHAFGANAGLGYEWAFRNGRFSPPAHFFLEARYHYANTRGRATEMIPITVGIRW